MIINETEQRKVYFTSDLHLGHKQPFVWESRGYSSTEDHDNVLIDTINSLVRENDILFNLGDFCLNTTVEKFEEYIGRINCKNIYMLFGNHPNPHYKKIYKPLIKSILSEAYTEHSELYPIRYKNIIYIGHYQEIIVNGQYMILSHYPHLVWNYMANGAFCLCGHSHGNCLESNSKNTYGKILDCGWDEHKKPLSTLEIINILKDKPIPTVDHHI